MIIRTDSSSSIQAVPSRTSPDAEDLPHCVVIFFGQKLNKKIASTGFVQLSIRTDGASQKVITPADGGNRAHSQSVPAHPDRSAIDVDFFGSDSE